MPRRINEHEYQISHERYMELKYFCYQYKEWKDWLRYNRDTVGSQPIDGLPHGKGGSSDQTAALAIRRQQLIKKCKIIEDAARETAGDLAPYIIKHVTDEHITYRYLVLIMGMQCSKKRYYKMRQQFFWMLNQKI